MSVRFLWNWNKESSLIITAPAPSFTEPNDNIVNSLWELTLRGYRVCTDSVQVYRVSERGSRPVVPGWPRSLALSGLTRWRRPDSPGQSVSWLRGTETQCCQCCEPHQDPANIRELRRSDWSERWPQVALAWADTGVTRVASLRAESSISVSVLWPVWRSLRKIFPAVKFLAAA